MSIWIGPIVTGVCLAGVLVGERLDKQWLKWIFKPLASLGFLIAAYAFGGLTTTYGQVMIGGLFLCMLGDVLLIPDGKATFLAGLVSFLTSTTKRSLAEMSANGSPGTATRSAILPGSTEPRESSTPSSSAAMMVAA